MLELQKQERFLGLIKYMEKCITNASALTALLRNLKSNDVDWQWPAVRDVSKLKCIFAKIPVLKVYDPKMHYLFKQMQAKMGLERVF